MYTRINSQPKLSSDFSLIYNAASEDNAAALDGLINGGINIDVRDNTGLFTPTARLAAEGNHEAVELLLSRQASKDFAAMGYARAGNVNAAEKLRKEYGINIKYLAVGAAMAESSSYANQLRLKFDLNAEWLIFGAAYAGRMTYLISLLSEFKARDKQNGAKSAVQRKIQEQALCARMKGLVLGGHCAEARVYLEQVKNTKSDLLLRVAIKAAARCGNEEFLESVIVSKGNDPDLLRYYYQLAAKSAAKGGHILFSRELLLRTDEAYRNNHVPQVKLKTDAVIDVVKAAIIYGHYNDVRRYFADIIQIDKTCFLKPRISISAYVKSYNDLAILAAGRGDLKLLENIYLRHKIPLHNVVMAMDSSGLLHNQKLLTYALSFIKDQKFLDALTHAAIEIASDPVALSSLRSQTQGWTSRFENQCFAVFKESQRSASKIHQLMHKYAFNYDQAEAFLASNELRTLLSLTAFNVNANAIAVYVNSTLADAVLMPVDDLCDLIEKYKLRIAKSYVESELSKYINRNYYSFYQHCDRAQSLISAAQEASSRGGLLSLLNYQHKLFNGDIIPAKNSSQPKHEQAPKNNGADDDFVITVTSLEDNFRLIR
ncbi:MAG TPA: hypothetical protein VL360_02410 [Gammaproteobacteria bacterium]|jgi:hypothetical protein|nr:hypothetical protein [Gammaproteobacteria bacterium]